MAGGPARSDAPRVQPHPAFDVPARRALRRRALAAALTAATLVLAMGSTGALAATTMTPACDGINLRTGPGTTYAIKTTVNEGASVTVDSTVTGGSWSATCGTAMSR